MKKISLKGLNIGNIVQKDLGLTGGAVAALKTEKFIPSGITIDPKLLAIIKMGVGNAITHFWGAKSPLIAGVGDGYAAQSGLELTQKMGVIAGVGYDEPYIIINEKSKEDITQMSGTGQL